MNKLHTRVISMSGVCALVLLLTATGAEAGTVLKFHSMMGNHGPYIGAANPIRGINAGGLPWVLDRGFGKVSDDGRLDVQVRGLIIPASSGFGNNPAPYFRATVSCLTIDANNLEAISNVSTTNGPEVMIGDPTKGNAHISEKLTLPNPCIAPIVFVTSPTGSWFAVDAISGDDNDDMTLDD